MGMVLDFPLPLPVAVPAPAAVAAPHPLRWPLIGSALLHLAAFVWFSPLGGAHAPEVSLPCPKYDDAVVNGRLYGGGLSVRVTVPLGTQGGGGPTSIATGDFDGDGRTDVVTNANIFTDGLLFLLNRSQ